MTRTFVFDLDGTLVDSVPDLLASCNRVMSAHGLAPFTAADVTAMVGDGAAALVGRIMAARDRVATPRDLEDFLADYMAHPAVETRPYPGAVAVLDLLASEGWTFSICTNKPEAAARKVLEALGLAHHFMVIGGGDSYPKRKPNPAHLLATIKAAGGSPQAAVMLGDHHNDMAAAKGAGVPAVFAAWGYGPEAMAAGAPIARRFADVPALARGLLPS